MEKVYIENAKKHTDKVCPTFNKKIDLNISIGTYLESTFHRTSSAVQKNVISYVPISCIQIEKISC